MPLYAMIESDPRWELEAVASIPVHLNGHWAETAHIKRCELDGVTIYFIGHDRFFKNATSNDRIYTPGIEQYLFFSAAALELPLALGWVPDVVHCNDWHTGFVPVLMREKLESSYEDTAAVFTIHNLAYQGEFGVEILDALALPRSLFVPELLETWGAVNFVKSGCVYSDQVNTVSPTYAREVQTPEFGCTLEGLMKHLAEDGILSGILNGIGTDDFDPGVDPYLEANYTAADPSRKTICRQALMNEIGMVPIEGAPLAGAVTRLSSQKGLNLLIEAAPRLFELPIQLVVQGLGDPALVSALRRLQNAYPRQLRFFEKFDEDLAHRIYSGSDMFVMPSLFEPCGLGQMIALRYGTIPVVRATGGLVDTISEGENGFLFQDKSPDGFVAAMTRAHKAFKNDKSWESMVAQAMKQDYGWTTSAVAYTAMYEKAISAVVESERKLA
jgi:starch synthase